MSATTVFLDHNATSPLAPEAAEAMAPWLGPVPANASSVHLHGQRARAAVEEARRQVAELLGADPHEVIFTSGGTESDNLALWGAMGWPPRGHLVVSAVEHPAVLEPAAALEAAGVAVSRLPVDRHGRVSLEDLRDLLRADTRLVSVMAANNEVGTVQPVQELAAVAREASVLFHCDAVQAAPWLDLRPVVAAVDLLSISSHKLGGPAGIGALWVRDGIRLEPLVRGGAQQQGRRGGTEATALAVGFGAACRRTIRRGAAAAARVAGLRDRLQERLLAAIPDARAMGDPERRLPNTLHVCFPGLDGNALVARLDLDGVAVSAGAACAAGVPQPSHVLEAMGVAPAYRGGPLRLSLGYGTRAEDVERAAEIIPSAVAAVRREKVEALI